MNYQRHEVAARLRGLFAGQDGGVLSGTARRLGVEEIALRMSVDETDPHPTFDVLMAVVREYGVDPTWLISGDYDITKHRHALEDDAAIARVLTDAVTNPTHPTIQRRRTPPRGTPTTSMTDEPVADSARPKLALLRDTRTRVIEAEGIRWKVREEPWPTVDRRGGSCLIFDSDSVVRRVRNFPHDWHEWSDADLYALSLGP